jgi:protein-S-isoprenylcysteine O-methyltransferase Ste14
MVQERAGGAFAQRPNRIPWPPILLLAALIVASVGGRLLGVTFHQSSLLTGLGWALVLAAGLIMAWAALTFQKHKTTILPHAGAEALITSGPFAYSRNPIYAAEALLLFGLGLAFASAWYLAVIPPFMVAVTHFAIQREEAHLEARFGDAWRTYAARVRRWV